MESVSAAYVCPHCQQTVDVLDPQAEQIIVCPHCQRDFLLPERLTTPSESEPIAPSAEDQLDGLRIRQLSSLRRATYRSRSYAIIAACACTVAVAQLGVMLIRELLTRGWDLWSIGYILLGIAAICGAWHFTGQALQTPQSLMLKRDADADGSAHVPDFTPLGDGTELHEKLNRIE